jgi:hypothetical protein
MDSKQEQEKIVQKGMVLGYLLRSSAPEFSVGITKIAKDLDLEPDCVSDVLLNLATENRISLTISRAVIRLGGES